MSKDRQRSPGAIEAGQIWLVEQTAAADLSARGRGAVLGANVVLYDRALAPLVAEILPLGAYAEPLPQEATTALSPRALAFAADGWSVVQLVEPCASRRARLESAAATAPGGAGRLKLRVLAAADEGGDADPLTLVFGPVIGRAPAQGGTFTANGLAG